MESRQSKTTLNGDPLEKQADFIAFDEDILDKGGLEIPKTVRSTMEPREIDIFASISAMEEKYITTEETETLFSERVRYLPF